jgi:hypothetical protein
MPRSEKISTMSRWARPASGARSRSNITTRVGVGEVMVAAKSSKLGRLMFGSPRAKTAEGLPAAAACSSRRMSTVIPSAGGVCA